jgi:DtxR family Mn-dependent transcriptional regulator
VAGSEAHSVEDYLEAIYELAEEGERVVQARVARRLGVTRASVSEQIQRLARMGLIEITQREVSLTPHGFAVAEDAVRKHRLAERFLTDVLEMPWHLAHAEANRFQSGITGAIEERMLQMLGGPATCPHGNPIPGTGAVFARDATPLRSFKAGDKVTLVRLLEDVELDGEAMRYFEENGLMPGARIDVIAVAPDGTMSLAIGRKKASIGPKLTDNLWVADRPVAAAEAVAVRNARDKS